MKKKKKNQCFVFDLDDAITAQAIVLDSSTHSVSNFPPHRHCIPTSSMHAN